MCAISPQGFLSYKKKKKAGLRCEFQLCSLLLGWLKMHNTLYVYWVSAVNEKPSNYALTKETCWIDGYVGGLLKDDISLFVD